MTGIFAQFQPQYAEHRIATFPVSAAKRPLIKGWPKVGLKASAELADKFTYADAFGYLCGRRSNVTVLDIDTTDEKIAEDAIRRHGQPRIVIRTASGKRHLLYRYDGEGRRIRPWPKLPIDLLGDNGYALAAPSKLATGSYEIIHGHLDDLDRLTPMVGIEAPTPSIPAGDPAQCIRAGRRNTELWRYCMKQAHACADRRSILQQPARSARCAGDAPCNSRSKTVALFDHLVGAGEQGVRNLEAERLRSLEVDGQPEFGRVLHRQIGRFLPLEDANCKSSRR